MNCKGELEVNQLTNVEKTGFVRKRFQDSARPYIIVKDHNLNTHLKIRTGTNVLKNR